MHPSHCKSSKKYYESHKEEKKAAISKYHHENRERENARRKELKKERDGIYEIMMDEMIDNFEKENHMTFKFMEQIVKKKIPKRITNGSLT